MPINTPNAVAHPPPLTLYYLGKPVRLLQHHGHCCLLADDILALSSPRLRRFLQQHMNKHPACSLTLPDHDTPQPGWPTGTLQRALRQSKRPAARQLRLWLQQQVLPALHQLPPNAPRWEHALALAAEAGQQISHAVLQTLLEQGMGWQHSQWLLTLHHSPDHPRRHAHGRLVALDSQVTPLQALARQIAQPDGLSANNADLLKLATACHQQLALRMEKQAWRAQATARGMPEPSA
ncbi:MAG: hypothetical protein JO338_09940 [Aquitalea sp.]|nr:hypothetical protein [Aquitalea sp.]